MHLRSFSCFTTLPWKWSPNSGWTSRICVGIWHLRVISSMVRFISKSVTAFIRLFILQDSYETLLSFQNICCFLLRYGRVYLKCFRATEFVMGYPRYLRYLLNSQEERGECRHWYFTACFIMNICFLERGSYEWSENMVLQLLRKVSLSRGSIQYLLISQQNNKEKNTFCLNISTLYKWKCN